MIKTPYMNLKELQKQFLDTTDDQKRFNLIDKAFFSEYNNRSCHFSDICLRMLNDKTIPREYRESILRHLDDTDIGIKLIQE